MYALGWTINSPNLRLHDVILNDKWNLDKLLSLGGSALVEDIQCSQVQLRIGNDELIWCPSSNGLFSTSSAWSLIGSTKSSALLCKIIWNSNMLPKSLFFVGVFGRMWFQWMKLLCVVGFLLFPNVNAVHRDMKKQQTIFSLTILLLFRHGNILVIYLGFACLQIFLGGL